MLIPAFLIGSLEPGLASADLSARAQLAPVFDTYIDPATPTTNYGREAALVLGNRRAILVDFPQLQWQRYNGKKLKSAKIILTFSRDISTTPVTVSSVSRRWIEGENRVLRFDRVDPTRTVWGQATWNHAIQGPGGYKWNDGGAKGTADIAPIASATSELKLDKLEITGITEAVQNQLNNPQSHFGFRIESERSVAFFSGDTGAERPRLELEWEETTPAGSDLALMTVTQTDAEGNYLAIIKNVGSAPAPGATFEFAPTGEAAQTVDVIGPIEPGSTKSVRFNSRKAGDPSDPRRVQLQTKLTAVGDQHLGNNTLSLALSGRTIAFEATPEQLAAIKELSPAGEPLLLYQALVARLNNHIFPFSRSIQFPEGAYLRLNLALDPLAADYRVNLNNLTELSEVEILRTAVRSLTPLNGTFRTPPSDAAPWLNATNSNLSWLPDTRDDGRRIPSLELPAPGFDTPGNPVPLPDEGLISRAEVAYLQASLGKPANQPFTWSDFSSGLLARAFSAHGDTLLDTKISLFRPGYSTPILTGDSGKGGIIYFTNAEVKANPLFSKDAANSAWLLARAERNGATATTWLPIWQVQEWFDRGNTGIASVELRFNLPTQALDFAQNLASERIITDAAGRFPAELSKLVDGNLDQGLTIAPGQWIEIDLGRDRMVGQINLTTIGDVSAPLHIFQYGTSQNISSAIRWVTLENLPFLSQLYGSKVGEAVTTPIINRTAQMRYVRFINRGETPISISEVQIFPTKN